MLNTLTISNNQADEARNALKQRRAYLSGLRSSDDVKIALQLEMIADVDASLALLDIPGRKKCNEHTVAVGDRVSFDSDEGYQAGTVSDLRRDVGNGELHAWVELDHQWPGMFRAVPLSAIVFIRPALLVAA